MIEEVNTESIDNLYAVLSEDKSLNDTGFNSQNIENALINSVDVVTMRPEDYKPFPIMASAYFAKTKHEGQLDDDGKPYFGHCMQVYDILKMLGCEEHVLVAGMLHDTIEDTDTTYEELVWRFGSKVADLVMEVTHEGKKDQHGYYFPRLKSREGILIKFADRLSNLTRMDSWPQERQEQYLRKSKFWKDHGPEGDSDVG